jgi:GrpB-like predicted nucleotidyltransferase (UPF0157 family)
MEDRARVEDDRVVIVPHDTSWKARFDAEKELLEPVIGPWVTGGIHHVGSTAVPGLAAKPVIDILAGVEDLCSSRACFAPVEALGYQYAPYRAEEMHWFCKPSPAHRTHHLHLVPTGSRRYRAELAFRDLLRRRPDLAGRYESLKRLLAVEHAYDREAYTKGKGSLIAEMVSIAWREREVGELTGRVTQWARARPDIVCVALVGSWARDAGHVHSDLDLILLADDPARYQQRDDWLAGLGDPTVVGRRSWGAVGEVRTRLDSGLEVEFAIASPAWADPTRVDDGTRRVVRDGFRVLVDPHGVAAKLRAAVHG